MHLSLSSLFFSAFPHMLKSASGFSLSVRLSVCASVGDDICIPGMRTSVLMLSTCMFGSIQEH